MQRSRQGNTLDVYVPKPPGFRVTNAHAGVQLDG